MILNENTFLVPTKSINLIKFYHEKTNMENLICDIQSPLANLRTLCQ